MRKQRKRMSTVIPKAKKACTVSLQRPLAFVVLLGLYRFEPLNPKMHDCGSRFKLFFLHLLHPRVGIRCQIQETIPEEKKLFNYENKSHAVEDDIYEWPQGPLGRGAQGTVLKLNRQKDRKGIFDEEVSWTGSESVAMVAMWNKSAAWIPFWNAFSTPLTQVDPDRMRMSLVSRYAFHSGKKRRILTRCYRLP